LLKDKQCIQQITRPKMGKNASGRARPSLSIVHNYVSAFTTNEPDPTPRTVIYSLGVVAVFRHAQDIVWQFPVLHVANCHDKIWWTMSGYFPVYWFWATVCALTTDNRYNCALPSPHTGRQVSKKQFQTDKRPGHDVKLHPHRVMSRAWRWTASTFSLSLVAFCTSVSWGRPVSVSSYSFVFIYESWLYLI